MNRATPLHLASPPERRSYTAPKSLPLGVVDQIRQACKERNRLATFLGFLLGGFVPIASYVVAHFEIDPAVAVYAQLPSLLVLAGLVYSAKTVYSWGQLAFASGAKATGFVLLIEGVMVTSTSPGLAMTALGYLVVINGLATGCILSLGATRKR